MKKTSQVVAMTVLPLLLTSCRGAATMARAMNRTEQGRELLTTLLPGIALAGAFYACLYFMADLENNKNLNGDAKGFAILLFVCEVIGFFLPDSLRALLGLAEICALVIIPYRIFKMSFGKSLGVMGICLAASFVVGCLVG